MLKLEARSQPSDFWRIASPLLALVLTVVLGVILFVMLGKDPVKGLAVFFWEPSTTVSTKANKGEAMRQKSEGWERASSLNTVIAPMLLRGPTNRSSNCR